MLTGIAATGFMGWQSEHRKVEELQTQIEELKKQEMRSAVMRSVSAQMEEIANAQREISDEKREEALRQTKVAHEMRRRSEIERQNALEAERNAVASEKKALEASALAENQRQIAEHQRIQAEFSKRKADTLSYIALGRSLGSISTIQAQAGNDELATILSYASYLYTSRFHGDIYYPSVFQSLMQSSKSMISWTEHTGAVMNLEYLPGEFGRIVSVSNYGEIMLSKLPLGTEQGFTLKKGNRLQAMPLFKNNQYDFRDVLTDPSTGCIYAVSRTGHLVMVEADLKTNKTLELNTIVHPMKLHALNEQTLLAVGENALALIDLQRKTVKSTQTFPFRVLAVSDKDGQLLLFDDQGMMHLMQSPDDFFSVKVPVTGKVTAYCASKEAGIEAYGMSDGTIWLADRNGNLRQLLGHRSRISKMRMDGRLLYSASYDGSVNLWIPTNEKVEPMTLIETGNWIMHFNFDSTRNTFCMGDVKGNLTAVNISIPLMVDVIKKKMKRNLTTEEWNYFIGHDVPYEAFVGK